MGGRLQWNTQFTAELGLDPGYQRTLFVRLDRLSEAEVVGTVGTSLFTYMANIGPHRTTSAIHLGKPDNSLETVVRKTRYQSNKVEPRHCEG